jgi:hypothetical protein
LAAYKAVGLPYRTNTNRPIGKNKLAGAVKELHKRTGCVAPPHGKVSNHGERAYSIQRMADKGVNAAENVTAARHRSAVANAGYHSLSSVGRDSRNNAEKMKGFGMAAADDDKDLQGQVSVKQQQAPVDERQPEAIQVPVAPVSAAPSINQVVALPQPRIAEVDTVAALNRFTVTELEGTNPRGLIGEDYQDHRTMTTARRQGVQYMHNHGVSVQDIMAAAYHQLQIQQQMQYQFGVQQVNANNTYGIHPIVQAMNQFQANNNGNFDVGAVKNQEQQCIDCGRRYNTGNPQMDGMF